MVKDRSIIRDGNHFIWLDEVGWVLIDGPWFYRLNPAAGHQMVPVWEVSKILTIANDLYPKYHERKLLEWERITWRASHQKIDPRLPLHWKYRELFIANRYKTGWRISPDGRLPILYNAIEWEDDMGYWLSEMQRAYR